MTSCSGLGSYKVWSVDRKIRKGILAGSYSELVLKCQEKFQITEDDFKFVMENDGTEIDMDFFPYLEKNTVLVILKAGEQWSPQGVTSTVDSNESSEHELKVMGLIQDLRNKKLKSKRTGLNIPKNGLVTLHVGWLNYSYRCQTYQMMKSSKSHPNNGPRTIKVNAGTTFKTIKQRLREEFFPNGRSHLGKATDFTCQVGTFDGDVINEDLTAEKHLEKSANRRVYLLSKGLMSLGTTSSSSSDDLPEITFPKRRKQTHSPQQMERQLFDHVSMHLSPPATIQQHMTQPSSTMTQPSSTIQQYVTQPSVTLLSTEPDLQDDVGEMLQPYCENTGTPTVTFNPSSVKCCVCYERTRESFLIPCGHIFCTVCAVQLQSTTCSCAICRAKIQSIGALHNN